MTAASRAPDPSATVTSRRVSGGLVEVAPLSLVVLAEAAWIAALAALIDGLSARPSAIGILGFTAFVAIGVLAARLLGRRLGRGWPVAALVIVAIGVVAGTLVSADARAAITADPGAVLAAHPAGWLAGLAVMRGFADARIPLPEDSIARLLTVGIPGLAVIAMTGFVIGEPFRPAFEAEAMAAAVVFVVAATVAMALTRLTSIGHDGGFDWRRNPVWIGLVLAVLAIAIAATVSLTMFGASLIQVVTGVVVGGLIVVAVGAGLDRSILRPVLVLLAFEIALYLLVSSIEPGDLDPVVPPPPAGSEGSGSVAGQVLTLGFGGLVLLAVIVAIVVLAAVWMRRTRLPIDDVIEESRTIDRGPSEKTERPWRRRSWRRHDPSDAATAYVALVEDLATDAAMRRDPAETPAEHASRLRAEGRADLSLDLLAADYALARYGSRELPAREHRRAVGRWRALRRRLAKKQA